MAAWNEYEIRLVFENYFIQGVSYGETKEEALMSLEARLDFLIPEPLEIEIAHTGTMAD